MKKRNRRAAKRAHRYRELIHELNRRYYQEHQRAERLQADVALLQLLRATWIFRRLQRLRSWLRKKFLERRSRCYLNEPIPIEPTTPTGTVSIIIPFRDRLELLRDCLRSIRHSTYRDYEIVLVDNDSADKQMHRYLCRALLHWRFHVVHVPGEFNFSYLCNRAAEQAKGDYLLFLNNDTAVLDWDWLEQMLTVAQQPNVGITGATLLYTDDSIQHAGMFQRHDGKWDHLRRGEPWRPAETDDVLSANEVAAVTGACLLIRRELFLELEGFDERLPLIHNDTDLCERARAKGLKAAVAHRARLYHYESLSRGFGENA